MSGVVAGMSTRDLDLSEEAAAYHDTRLRFRIELAEVSRVALRRMTAHGVSLVREPRKWLDKRKAAVAIRT